MSNTPTLHQYFAAKAMQGICVNAGRNAHEFNKQDEIARTAFKLADAMLERGNVEAELLEALKELMLYFKSANDIAVERAVIRADAQEVIKARELIARIEK